MSNEQLAILLRSIISRLELAVSASDEMLLGAEREQIKIYKDQSMAGLCNSISDKNPDHWTIKEGDVIGLAPIHELIELLKLDEMSLCSDEIN